MRYIIDILRSDGTLLLTKEVFADDVFEVTHWAKIELRAAPDDAVSVEVRDDHGGVLETVRKTDPPPSNDGLY